MAVVTYFEQHFHPLWTENCLEVLQEPCRSPGCLWFCGAQQTACRGATAPLGQHKGGQLQSLSRRQQEALEQTGLLPAGVGNHREMQPRGDGNPACPKTTHPQAQERLQPAFPQPLTMTVDQLVYNLPASGRNFPSGGKTWM